MNNKFDELTRNLAQSVTRRAALKKFGVGLAGMALPCFGLANKAKAMGNGNGKCVQYCLGMDCSGLSGGAYDQCKRQCQEYCKLF